MSPQAAPDVVPVALEFPVQTPSSSPWPMILIIMAIFAIGMTVGGGAWYAFNRND